MVNKSQCSYGLVYNSFSVILLQTFTTDNLNNFIGITPFIKKRDISKTGLDKQIFAYDTKVINRYTLPSFGVKILIKEPDRRDSSGELLPVRETIIEGNVVVKASVFFNNTVQISYRFVVDLLDEEDSFCTSSQPLNSNEIIALASMVQSAEHWSLGKKIKDKDQEQEIEESVESIEITHISDFINKKNVNLTGLLPKKAMSEIYKMYRNFFDWSDDNGKRTRSHHYSYIDVWEDFEHGDPENSFLNLSEDEIIEHIETSHKPELIGIMSLYPYEWPYRAETSFSDICGENIAIDVDDLVLANQNVAIVFGTYGKRGEESETDWKDHLNIRSLYNTCWPEYLMIVELLLVKKELMQHILHTYIEASKLNKVKDTQLLIKQIEENAIVSVNMTNMLLKLNAVNYLRFVSHKHMYSKTAERMKIEEEEAYLRNIIENIDNTLINTNNIVQAHQSESTNKILFFITIASLFSVLMENDNIPVLSLVNLELSKGITVFLEIITVFAILYGCYFLYNAVQNKKRKNIKKI